MVAEENMRILQFTACEIYNSLKLCNEDRDFDELNNVFWTRFYFIFFFF